MRRDTQIGIILGVVILVVIGVFLSTRTTVKETKMPELILSEEGMAESEIEEIDISELAKEPKTKAAQRPTPVEELVEESVAKEELSETTTVELSKADTSLEGKWEGIGKDITKPEFVVSEAPVTEVVTEESLPAQQITTDEEEQQVASVDIHGETVHKVQSNDSLSKIARKYYGDVAKWKRIYEANRDNMSDPDALYVGQELLIPEITIAKQETQVFEAPSLEIKTDQEISVNVGTHTVKSGDTLFKLARKYYNDPAMWIKIYEANEDTIEDKSLLITGQTLIIPE